MKKSQTLAAVAGLTLIAGLASACGGSALGGTSNSSDNGRLKVGLLVSQSGVFSSVGDDMAKGFQLYLDQHDDMIGGRKVDLVTVDEGSDPQGGVAGASRLAQQDKVDVAVGIVSSATAMGSRDIFEAAQIPVLMGNTGAVQLGKDLKSDWIFRASYDNGDPGRLLGKYLGKDSSTGKVFLMASDYAGGHETIDGFKETFPADRIAGELYTPLGTTSDYSPYLAKVRASGADAVFAFYAGGEAISFTKQFNQFGLSKSVKLYGAGFLTEGSVLDAEGNAALGVLNATRYNWDVKNVENKQFVTAFQKKYGALPTVFAANMYDIGIMLDKATASIKGTATHKAIRDAIAGLKTVSGVRGNLTFNDANTVEQEFYLVKVEKTPEGLRNVIVGDLGRS